MSQTINLVDTNRSPQPIGPYAQAITSAGFVFCSGQIGLNPETAVLASDTVRQTRQALDNLNAILLAAGSSLSQVVRTEIYLTNMADFETVNEVYAHYFLIPPQPARVTIVVAALPKNALVEIACIARQIEGQS